jgi:hypothetical protein
VTCAGLVSFILFGLTIFMPELLRDLPQRRQWPHDMFVLTLGILPGFAAVVVGHAEQLAFKAQARQYDRMRQLFERALDLLPKEANAMDTKLVQGVFYEIGKEAMSENAEWVAIFRQRPIRPPQ